MTTHTVEPVLCVALFVSELSRTCDLDNSTVRDVVERTLEELGPEGCCAHAAEMFGNRRDVALSRSTWARELCSRAMTLAAGR